MKLPKSFSVANAMEKESFNVEDVGGMDNFAVRNVNVKAKYMSNVMYVTDLAKDFKPMGTVDTPYPITTITIITAKICAQR